MWEQANYQWSLEKYQAVGAQIVEGVVKNVGLRAGSAVGAASAGANSTLLRERYVSNLVAKVPTRNAILLKTVEELRLLNLDDGTTEWTVEEVAGSSLMHVEWLPSGDVVLATDYTDLLGRVSGGKKVLRINPENGTVKWRADHDADAVQNAFLKNGLLLLRHGDGDIEAFQTTDGTKAYEIGMDWTAKLSSSLAGVNYQGEQYNYQRSGEPVLHGNSVYIPDLADTDVVGAPDYNVQQVDLATGTNQWTSEPVKKVNYLWDLTAVDDQLLGRAVLAGPENSLFGQEGRQKVVSWSLSDGTLQWKHEGPYYASSKTVVTSAMGLASPSHLNLVTHNGRAYTATDTSLAAYGIDDGAVEASASAQASGSQVWLAKHDQALVDLRDESVSFHSMSDLSPTRKPISFESELEFYAQEDDYLMVATEDVLHVINLRKQTLKGTIAPDEELGRLFVSGNLRSGVFVTEGAESIFVLTKDYVVTKYAIQ